MIETLEEARTFFKCLEGMDYRQICFHSNGKIAYLGECGECVDVLHCIFFTFYVDEPESPEMFIEMLGSRQDDN